MIRCSSLCGDFFLNQEGIDVAGVNKEPPSHLVEQVISRDGKDKHPVERVHMPALQRSSVA